MQGHGAQNGGAGRRVVVVGAGALGSLVAARLALAGTDVALYSRPSPHLERLRAAGLSLEELDGNRRVVPVTATDEPAILATAWLVVVLVKTWQTAAALAPLRGRIPPDAAILTLQNGLGNAAAIRDGLGGGDILVAVTTQAALRPEPGVVRHTGEGPTALGREDGGCRAPLARVAAALNGAGWPAVPVADIERWVWRKLAVNAAINPLTALAGVENRIIASDPGLREAAALLAGEVAAVAAARGLNLGDVAALTLEVARATGANRSSMLRDLEAGQPTEIEAINGAVAAEGARLGVPTPVNRVVAAVVAALGVRG